MAKRKNTEVLARVIRPEEMVAKDDYINKGSRCKRCKAAQHAAKDRTVLLTCISCHSEYYGSKIEAGLVRQARKRKNPFDALKSTKRKKG